MTPLFSVTAIHTLGFPLQRTVPRPRVVTSFPRTQSENVVAVAEVELYSAVANRTVRVVCIRRGGGQLPTTGVGVA